jgi:hypothetical protein
MQVEDARARDGGEAFDGVEIRRALELDRADQIPAQAGGDPFFDQAV